jgi:hypothetical protein
MKVLSSLTTNPTDSRAFTTAGALGFAIMISSPNTEPCGSSSLTNKRKINDINSKVNPLPIEDIFRVS